MNFFKERFGIAKIRLTPHEKIELQEELIKLDQKRIEFVSFVCFFISCFYLILDFFIFNDEHQSYYVFLDLMLLIVSLLVLTNVVANQVKLPTVFAFFKRNTVFIYPAFMLVWASGILVLKPDSLLNVITYFLTIFLLTFAIVTPLKRYLFYFGLVFVEFVILSFQLSTPIFSETFVLLSIGAFVSLPFFSTFASIRENMVASNMKLNKSNRSLESEVTKRVFELKQTNENLEYEIVQRKMVEIKLRDALKIAEESNKLKSEFLANISHEIRTPLNSIIGFSEMITEDSVSESRKKQYHELISSNTLYLLSIIDDIFDASLVHTNQIEAMNKPFNVNQFINFICYEASGFEAKHSKTNLKFTVRKLSNENLALVSDEYYLKKAIVRLLDNAYKFTSEGTINFGVIMRKGKLAFFVKDTGIGLYEKDFSRIFEPFVQGDGSFTRGYGGSGLGLTIVSGIVKALGCEFTFKTKPNKGSTFYLIFDKSLIVE